MSQKNIPNSYLNCIENLSNKVLELNKTLFDLKLENLFLNHKLKLHKKFEEIEQKYSNL